MKLLDDHPGDRLGDPGLQETEEAPGQVESLSAIGAGFGGQRRWSPTNRCVDLMGTWD